MFKSKLKRILAVTLATAVAFGGMTIAPVNRDDVVKVEAADEKVYDSSSNYTKGVAKDLSTVVNGTSRSFLWYTGKLDTGATSENSFYYCNNFSPESEVSFVDTKTAIEWTGTLCWIGYHRSGAYNYREGQYEYVEYAITNLKPKKGTSFITSDTLKLPASVDIEVSGSTVNAKCLELAEYALAGGTFSKVQIPDTYQRICDGAFSQCKNLTSIIFTKGNSDTVTDGSSLHALGSYVFAGCTALTEPLILDNLFRFRGTVDNKSKLPTMGRSDYNESPYINAQGVMDTEQPSYYMGSGTYQDCTALQDVVFTGSTSLKEVYVPEDTFAGCSSLKKLEMDGIDKIVIGKAAFAGSVGVGGNQLTNLDFNCDVVMDCFAFANCYKLKDVTFHKSFNKVENMGYEWSVKNNNLDYNLYKRYSQHGLNWGNFYGIFKDSFKTEGGTIRFKAEKGDNIIFPNGFLEGATGLSTIDFSGAKEADITIDKFAFKNVKCDKLNIQGSTVNIHTSAFNGYLGKELEVNSTVLNMCGEPFAKSAEEYTTTTSPSVDNNPLKKITLNSKTINFTPEYVSSAYKSKDGKYYVITKKTLSYATFYAVGEGTEIYFGDNVKDIKGTLKDSTVQDAVSIYSIVDVKHNALGSIKDVYITSPETKISKDCMNIGGSEYNLYGYSGVPTNDYVSILDSQPTYSALAKASGNISFKEYISKLHVKVIKDIVNTDFKKGFKPEYLKVTANYNGDVKNKVIDYAEDGVGGYTLTTKTKEYFEKAEYQNVTEPKDIYIQVEYNGAVSDEIESVVKPKALVGFTAGIKENAILVEGCTVSKSDIKIKDLAYNDDEISPELAGTEDIKVTVSNGSVLTPGINNITVTVNNVSKNITVTASPKSVVSMSAIQVNEVFEGETLDANDFKVTAYYNNGTTVEDFKDFDVLTKDKVTKDTKIATLALKGNENVAAVANLKVTELKPVAISARYTGDGVIAGQDVKKENVEVFITYNNGTSSEKLSTDKYSLFYAPIVGEKDNIVTVILNEDNTKQIPFTVRGIKATVYDTPAPATTAPVITIAPTAIIEPTKVPAGNTEIPVPTATATVNPGTSTTPSNPATTVPEAPTAVPGTSTVPGTPTVVPGTSTVPSTPTVVPTTTEIPVPTATVTPTTNVTENPLPNAQPTVGETKTSKVTLGVKEKLTISAVKPLQSYKSSNTKVATVSSKGVITAKKVGKATITVVDKNGTTLKVTVTVKKAPKKISASFKKKTLKVGKKVTLKAKFTKGYYSNKIKFTSSNKKVATVTSKGVIKAKKKGTCKITMKTYNGKKVTVKITVK